MKKLIFVWIVALGTLLSMVYYVKVKGTNFHGIADAREIIIDNENPVRIQKIHVVPGQVIKEMDTLIELCRPELDLEILAINNELEKISAEKTINSDYINAQINTIKVEGQTRINEIKTEIAELEATYQKNISLAGSLKSIKNSLPNDSSKLNSIRVKIKNLENVINSINEQMNVQIRDLRKSPQHTIQSQIDNFKEQLKLLKQEQGKLIIRSPIDGKIGAVNFKDGVNVAAFDTIITLHPRAPSSVYGYIHENARSTVSIGQEVLVTSITGKKEMIKGMVIGVGARIVQIPPRLWKRPDIEVWGREVQIKIPEDNPFLHGEKVLITLEEKIYEQ